CWVRVKYSTSSGAAKGSSTIIMGKSFQGCSIASALLLLRWLSIQRPIFQNSDLPAHIFA
ncbi:MAG: hypothetical protein Q3X03_04320, partial [Eggerthellaceae bacterium]|nr:hypothetical protein [Eggerthellaceae bacterium]